MKLSCAVCAAWGRKDFVPKVALVLKIGSGDYASQLRVEAAVDYHEIEGFPVSTVPGHTGRFVFGLCRGCRLCACRDVCIIMKDIPWRKWYGRSGWWNFWGAEVLFLTNAAGGIQLGMKAGDLMLLTGQIGKFCSVAAHWRKYRGTGTAVSGYEPDLWLWFTENRKKMCGRDRGGFKRGNVSAVYRAGSMNLHRRWQWRVLHSGSRCRRNEYGMWGCGGESYGDADCGNFLYLESGMRHFATAIVT